MLLPERSLLNSFDCMFILGNQIFAYEGSPVSLSCPVVNQSSTQVRWSKFIDGNNVRVAFAQFTGDSVLLRKYDGGPLYRRLSIHPTMKHVLAINQTVLGDDGVYTCIGRAHNHTVHLRIYGKLCLILICNLNRNI